VAAYQLDSYGISATAKFGAYEAGAAISARSLVRTALMKTAAAAWACGLVAALRLERDAHKGITSKFTWRRRLSCLPESCRRCHVDGGVGPMSLVMRDAFPWAVDPRRAALGVSDASAEVSAAQSHTWTTRFRQSRPPNFRASST
jgi:hypothetical protein